MGSKMLMRRSEVIYRVWYTLEEVVRPRQQWQQGIKAMIPRYLHICKFLRDYQKIWLILRRSRAQRWRCDESVQSGFLSFLMSGHGSKQSSEAQRTTTNTRTEYQHEERHENSTIYRRCLTWVGEKSRRRPIAEAQRWAVLPDLTAIPATRPGPGIGRRRTPGP